MKSKTTTAMALSAGQRECFELVHRASFSNPFSDERSELDALLAATPQAGSYPAVLTQTLQRVTTEVAALEANDGADYRSYRGRDQELVRYLFLFHVFHRTAPDFDVFIRQQIAAGAESLPVPFATAVLQRLERHGFTAVEAERYFSVFFQLRRAFYFIYHDLKGGSPCMRRVRMRLWNNIFTSSMRWYEDFCWNRMEDFSTLILGGTGTGKGAAAGAIGRCGHIPYDRRCGCFVESFTRGFIAVNLSQYPENLVESELFGHRKGAFTGAIDHYSGVLARCSAHGAIFLDEIGDVPAHLQLKLLQVLQERTFCPVGSHEPQRFNGRVIAATNQDLDKLRREGRFREDFYYRLCSDVIVMPSLHERLTENPAELEELVLHLVQVITGREAAELAKQVLAALLPRGLAYSWPGNVRELAQTVRRILVTGSAGELAGAADDAQIAGSVFETIVPGRIPQAEELLNAYCTWLVAKCGTYEQAARVSGLDRRTVKRRAG